MKPWLSILIPVYNVEAYLNECVDSVLSQWEEGVEIILLDDQSIDGSFKIMKQMAENSNAVVILQQEKNSGISAVRNRLIAAATGQYLWFLDSDDVMAKGALEELRGIVLAHSPDLIMCDYCIWRPETKILSKNWKRESHVASFSGPKNKLLSDPMQLFSGMYQKGKLHCWSKIFKRNLWSDDLSFPEGKYFEDMAVAPRLAIRVSSYYYTAKVWVKYRQRAGSILSVPSLKKIDDMTSAVDGVLALWRTKYPGIKLSARLIFASYCVKVYFFALKELKKIGLYNPEKVDLYRNLLLNNVQCGKFKLVWLLLLKGDIVKAMKLVRYFWFIKN